MRSFKLSDEYEVVCESQGTRRGFRHLATLLKNGNEIDKAKICYLNRTWESYEFESVLNKIIAQNPELKEKLDILGVLDG
jgi:uncharacterized Fe-S cluster-containing protein